MSIHARTVAAALIWLAVQAAVLLVLAGGALRAEERPRLEAFLQVTGFDVALDSIALSAREAPELLGMSASDFGSDWTRVSEEVFAQDILHGIALDILDATLNDDLLTAAAEFYASPLGQRLVEVENAAHMVADSEAKQAEGAALVEEMSDARIAVLRRLGEAVDSEGVAIGAIREVQVRFLMAASLAGVLDRELDEDVLRKVLSAGDDELRAALKVSALNNAAYTYRDFSDADLRSYAEALETPKMQRVYELMNAIHFEIMADRFEVLALRMADLHPGQAL